MLLTQLDFGIVEEVLTNLLKNLLFSCWICFFLNYLLWLDLLRRFYRREMNFLPTEAVLLRWLLDLSAFMILLTMPPFYFEILYPEFWYKFTLSFNDAWIQAFCLPSFVSIINLTFGLDKSKEMSFVGLGSFS